MILFREQFFEALSLSEFVRAREAPNGDLGEWRVKRRRRPVLARRRMLQ